MEIDIRDKEIINQTVNFVRTYHSKQSKLPTVPGPDEEGLKLLARVYTIAKKYRQLEKENHYKDEYGASTWRGDFEFYRNIHFVLTWCDKFSVCIDAYFPIDPNGQEQPHQGPAPAAKVGRPSQLDKTVKDYMLLKDDDQKDELLNKLHELIDGEKGRGTALVVLVCEVMGLMTKPGYTVMVKEFGDIGARSGYDGYHDKGINYFKKEEINGIMTHLARFKDGLK